MSERKQIRRTGTRCIINDELIGIVLSGYHFSNEDDKEFKTNGE